MCFFEKYNISRSSICFYCKNINAEKKPIKLLFIEIVQNRHIFGVWRRCASRIVSFTLWAELLQKRSSKLSYEEIQRILRCFAHVTFIAAYKGTHENVIHFDTICIGGIPLQINEHLFHDCIFRTNINEFESQQHFKIFIKYVFYNALQSRTRIKLTQRTNSTCFNLTEAPHVFYSHTHVGIFNQALKRHHQNIPTRRKIRHSNTYVSNFRLSTTELSFFSIIKSSTNALNRVWSLPTHLYTRNYINLIKIKYLK